jgi:urease accessory protein
LDKIFAGNRAVADVTLEVVAENGMTRRRRVAEHGPLRVRCPNSDGDSLEAMIVNTAGGIAGGDCHRLNITAGEGARLTVTTAAAEKVYRSLGPNAEIDVRLVVAAGARLAWLPQETILFDRARLSRRVDVDLAEGAALLIAEAVVFGRSAMGEAVNEGFLSDRWRLRRNGQLIFAETMRLDGPISRKLAEPARAAGDVATAIVLAAPADEAAAERVRALSESFSGEVGISAWNGLAVARLCAKDGTALREDLAAALTALGGELPRLWLN